MAGSTARRWWIAGGLCFLMLALVVGFALWRRTQGSPELQALLAHSAEDKAWLDALPDLPPATRDRVEVVMCGNWPKNVFQLKGTQLWYFQDKQPDPKLLEEHERLRSAIAPILELLDQEGICLSSAAFKGRPGDSPPPYVNHRVVSLLVGRLATDWLALDALVSERPLLALDRLDRMERAMRPCAGLMDGLLWGSVANDRDEAYLRLLVKGVLPTERRKNWVAEPALHRQILRDGLRAERLLYLAPLARDVAACKASAQDFLYEGGMDVEDWFDWHFLQPADCVHGLRGERQVEEALASNDPRTALATFDRRYEGHMWVADLEPLLWVVFQQRTRHRLLRLAGRLAAGGGLAPADEAELRVLRPEVGRMLDGGPWDLALAYERLGPRRVRIFFSPTTPLPTELESYRSALPKAGAHIPVPADESPSPLLVKHDEVVLDLVR